MQWGQEGLLGSAPMSVQKVPSGSVMLRVRRPASGSSKHGVYTATELLLLSCACNSTLLHITSTASLGFPDAGDFWLL